MSTTPKKTESKRGKATMTDKASKICHEAGSLSDDALDKVTGGTRSKKAQSDISAKYSQFHDGIAQNFK